MTRLDHNRAIAQVAAKTGTSRMVSPDKVNTKDAYMWADGRYHYVAAFTGFLPADRPQVSITVIIEDSSAGLTGATAAGLPPRATGCPSPMPSTPRRAPTPIELGQRRDERPRIGTIPTDSERHAFVRLPLEQLVVESV